MSHRISAGAIVLREDKILPVRHLKTGDYDFLVMPGGCVNLNEDARGAAKREAREEAGIEVEPVKVAYVEELQLGDEETANYGFYCKALSGEPSAAAEEARREYIVSAGFYSRNEIKDKIAFPPILFTDEFWENAKQEFPRTEYLGLREQLF